MERYYQKEIECASQEQIRSWQDERLVRQVRHVWDNVPYYRAKMEAAHIAPDDIKSRDDLYKLPFLSKADLREAYPFGLLAEPLEKCIRRASQSRSDHAPQKVPIIRYDIKGRSRTDINDDERSAILLIGTDYIHDAVCTDFPRILVFETDTRLDSRADHQRMDIEIALAHLDHGHHERRHNR